jgi:ElaB/YqjD/DUF883 family membrane-anchored ribosome-binding protein
MQKNGTTDAGSTAQLAEDKIDSIKETVKGIVDQGAQKVDAIKNRVVEVKDQALDRGSDVIERMTDLIKAHPLQAVGIAFGVGYLGMRLFRR